MSALVADRNTLAKGINLIELPAAGNVTFYTGGIVVINAQGFACPGKTAVNLVAMGCADAHLSTIGMPDGAANIAVFRSRQFRWANSPADPITQAMLGRPCYILDDQTVAATNGGNTRSQAGIVFSLDANGVWVAI